ncbi:MAG: UDP-3-O-[3-hydroxymyristoyl] glucosamine N-acyltransferase [Crocinitomix sp.]|jgi:UDP-3-O-[3-hydroxymyristoyl] glucosamine N-acyltransferase
MIELKKISAHFDLSVVGNPDRTIQCVTALANQQADGLTWAKADQYAEKIEVGTLLVNEAINFEPKEGVTYLITKKDAKLTLSLIMKEFFTPSPEYYLLDDTARHRKNSKLKIADQAFIGQNVTIGDGTVIHPFAVIEADSIIGKNCVIKSNTSIGSEGMGIALNPETDLLEKLPQIGNVVMQDHVDIGPNTTVRRGALGETLIKEGCKIGALINIGHNCVIGRNVILTCNNVVSGSAIIGDYVYLGVNAMIRNGIEIGEKTQIGMGAVVTKSLPANVIAYGIPAKVIRSNES